MSVAADEDRLTSRDVLYVADKKTRSEPCCSTLKMFIVALSFAYFSKALSGTYMKSAITQIERRFDLSSSLIGLIDGSFEMGNLLFLAFVSHFGAKMHRPRLIGIGCFLMAVGSLLTGLPHFFMGRYKFDTVIQSWENDSMRISPCLDSRAAQDHPEVQIEISQDIDADCVRDSGSHMWIYVFLGNALRGIGETPVTPLGISYIDDYAKAENSAFYIACLQTITLLGPMFGFLLGSMCARLYVDIGFVDVESVTITPKDARWVGAWWLGFFVSAGIMLLSGIPFWFLPRTLPKQGELPNNPYTLPETPAPGTDANAAKLAAIAKGFLPCLKRLLSTPAYFLLLCGVVLKFNSFIGLLTFKAKYMEQQFGQSASRANFLIGVLNLPVVAVGIFLGGVVMKRYKLSVVAGAQLSFLTSFAAYLLLLLQYSTKCDNVHVAGLTVSYNGTPGVSFDDHTLFSECNRKCSCASDEWDPVCSQNGITYMSPCLAGCTGSTGHGKHTVFHNCSCVLDSSPVDGSTSVSLGQCPRGPDCSRSFTSYMAVSVLSSFINSLGTTPGYMVIIRCISPELKSLALGIQTLVMRTLGGIPAPVYFGALIDSTCLKWGTKRCGGKGACRMYDTDMYRVIFLGLITCLSGCSYFFIMAVIVLLKRQFDREKATPTEQGRAPTPPGGAIELLHHHQHPHPHPSPHPKEEGVPNALAAACEMSKPQACSEEQAEGTEGDAEPQHSPSPPSTPRSSSTARTASPPSLGRVDEDQSENPDGGSDENQHTDPKAGPPEG
ncbi:solute carrier organic anion transporter family member 1C1 isoform X1 [Alosa sapidissima]|uniref:solute carrier organic anion transporter family member 1C1 isoform X1 n=1 Tax=Alosa sapidissima TaxID=34773 RepID=UPI001C08CCC8|nr:solute carrier organic anion transporter family member 1C1 isoform X1 [Alosa sapidissima]